jgi:hypothetical protein
MTTSTGELARLLDELDALLVRAGSTGEATESIVLSRGIERARVVLGALRWELPGYPDEPEPEDGEG